MDDLTKKIDKAIEVYKNFEPADGYYVCYSGGKDSDVIRILADMAGVKYELHNNHTTVDAPETVYYIREVMRKYGERESNRSNRRTYDFQVRRTGFYTPSVKDHVAVDSRTGNTNKNYAFLLFRIKGKRREGAFVCNRRKKSRKF